MINTLNVQFLTVASDPGVMGTRPTSVNPYTLADKGKMTKEKHNECHQAVTNYVVKFASLFYSGVSMVDVHTQREKK